MKLCNDFSSLLLLLLLLFCLYFSFGGTGGTLFVFAAVAMVAVAVDGLSRKPANYHDRMPETSFTCGGKVVGGYYADPDADCQMFHVCVQVDENDVIINGSPVCLT